MSSTKTSKIFADRLSDLMEKERRKGKTVKSIAAATGLSTGALSNYRNDIQQASISAARDLADYFHVTTDFLLGRTADPKKQPSVADDLGISDNALRSLKALRRTEIELGIFGAADRLLTSELLPEIMTCLDTIAKSVEAESARVDLFSSPEAMLAAEPAERDRMDSLNDRSTGFKLVTNREHIALEVEMLVDLFRRYVCEASGYDELMQQIFGSTSVPLSTTRPVYFTPNIEKDSP